MAMAEKINTAREVEHMKYSIKAKYEVIRDETSTSP
jgi:hypothetical protein